MRAVPVTAGIVFTVGPSSRRWRRFRACSPAIVSNVLVDVRSVPYSGLHPQFNQPVLHRAFAVSGVRYRSAGKLLGGRPADAAYYDDEGKVLYWKLAQARAFQRGIDRLLALAGGRPPGRRHVAPRKTPPPVTAACSWDAPSCFGAAARRISEGMAISKRSRS